MIKYRRLLGCLLLLTVVVSGVMGAGLLMATATPTLESPGLAPQGTIAVISDLPDVPGRNQAVRSTVANLTSLGLPMDVYYNNWYLGAGANYTADLAFLEQYRLVVYLQSNRLTTAAEESALEAYVQGGGNLFVGGYDVLGSPTDARMARIVRSSTDGDDTGEIGFHTVTVIHPVTQGPVWTFSGGSPFTAAASNADLMTANTTAGAVAICENDGGASDRVIATDLPGAGGKVVAWLAGDVNLNRLDWSVYANALDLFQNIVLWMYDGPVNRPAELLVISTMPTGGHQTGNDSALMVIGRLGWGYDLVYDTNVTTGEYAYADYDAVIMVMHTGDIHHGGLQDLVTYMQAGGQVFWLGSAWKWQAALNATGLMTVTDADPPAWTIPSSPDLYNVDPSDPLAAGLGWDHNFVSSEAAAYNTEVLDGMEVIMVNGDGWPALMRRAVGSGQLVWFNGRVGRNSYEPVDYEWFRILTRNVLNEFFGTAPAMPRTLFLDMKATPGSTSNRTTGDALLEAGYTYDYVYDKNTTDTEYDLSGYDLFVLDMNGGYVNKFLNTTVAPWVRSGGKLLMFAGTDTPEFEATWNGTLVTYVNQNWNIQNTFHVALPSPLTEGIPQNYEWAGILASYAVVKISSPIAKPIVAGTDAFLVGYDRIEDGEFIWFTNSPRDNYFTDPMDLAVMQRLIQNALGVLFQDRRMAVVDASHQSVLMRSIKSASISGYLAFASVANLTGWHLTEINGAPGADNITSSVLTGMDGLILLDPRTNFSVVEQTAIEAFGAGGGTVLLIIEDSADRNFNETFAGFGLVFTDTWAGDSNSVPFLAHPISRNSPMIDPYVNQHTLIPDEVTTITVYNGSNGPTLVAAGVSRRFVAVADSNIFDNDMWGIINDNNSLLAYNILAWLNDGERGPMIQFNRPAAGLRTNETEVVIWWTGYAAYPGTTHWVALDGEDWINKGNQSVHVVYGLSEGIHTVSVRQQTHGWENRTISQSFEVDLTGPTVEITAPDTVVNRTTATADIEVTWTTADTDAVKYFVRLNTTAWVELAGTSQVFLNLSAGVYEIELIGQDDLGNNGTLVTKTFTLVYQPGGLLGGLPLELILILAGVGVVVIVVVVVMMRRRGSAPPPAPRRRKRTPKGA